jgi:hypothetical protein
LGLVLMKRERGREEMGNLREKKRERDGSKF